MNSYKLIVLLTVGMLMMGRAVQAQSIPEEARRHMVRGRTAVAMAKSPDEYAQAIKEFQEAVRLAPDWPDPLYNLATLQEKTGKLKEAAASFKEYLRLAPNVPEAPRIRDHIYELEYKAEQILTVSEVVDVLVSSSDDRAWEAVGDCDRSTIGFKRSDSKNESLVSVMTAFFLTTGEQRYDSKVVSGPAMKGWFVVHKYPRGACVVPAGGIMDECLSFEKREVEVVSKELVRVKRTLMRRVPTGKPELGEIAGTFTCTLRKK